MAWINDDNWRRRLALREPGEFPKDPITDPLGPHWVPTYAPGRTMPQNVFSLARRVFGRAMSEWALLLANEVVAAIPDASAEQEAPAWAAAVLWCVALHMQMDDDPRMWEHIEGDIFDMTNVNPAVARRRWQHLKRLGMTAPKAGLAGFADDWPKDAGATSNDLP